MCTYGNKNIKQQLKKHQHNKHNFKCLYSMFANHHISVVHNIHHHKEEEEEEERNQTYPWYTNLCKLDFHGLEVFQMYTTLIQWIL